MAPATTFANFLFIFRTALAARLAKHVIRRLRQAIQDEFQSGWDVQLADLDDASHVDKGAERQFRRPITDQPGAERVAAGLTAAMQMTNNALAREAGILTRSPPATHLGNVNFPWSGS